MAATPSYASTPLPVASVQISTANTNLNGTGTIATLLTGTTAGIVIEQTKITGVGTVTQGMIRFFVSINAGTTWRLYDEVAVNQTSGGGTLLNFTALAPDLTGFTLQSANVMLGVATNNAEVFNVVANIASL